MPADSVPIVGFAVDWFNPDRRWPVAEPDRPYQVCAEKATVTELAWHRDRKAQQEMRDHAGAILAAYADESTTPGTRSHIAATVGGLIARLETDTMRPDEAPADAEQPAASSARPPQYGAGEIFTGHMAETDDIFSQAGRTALDGTWHDAGPFMAIARKHPPLSHEAEIQLFEAVEAGVLAQEQLDIAASIGTVPDGQRRADLRELARRGAAAESAIIRHYQRLVLKHAVRYIGHGVALEDLIQDANCGVSIGGVSESGGILGALHRFDHRRGFRFITLARHYVDKSLKQSLQIRGTMIRVPEKTRRLHRQHREDAAGLAAKLGRQPTDAEIGAAYGYTADELERIHAVEALGGGRTDSLDAPINDDGTVLDAVQGDLDDRQTAHDPEEAVDDRHRDYAPPDYLRAARPTLTAIQYRALVAHYFTPGKEDDIQHTARIIGTDPRRARQILELAAGRMRAYLEREGGR